jgi:DNA-binding response OmpR family regulator
MHALILGFESLVALMIQDVLEEAGFDTFAIASTAEAGVKAATEKCPDLIVADVDARGGCGIEAVQSICAAKTIPVIFATDTFRDALTRLPMAMTLRKPFGAVALTAAVAEVRAGRGSY